MAPGLCRPGCVHLQAGSSGPAPGRTSQRPDPITGGGRYGVRTCVPCSGGCLSRMRPQPPGSATWPSSAGPTPELGKGRAAVILRRTTERQRRTESDVPAGAEPQALPLVPQARPGPQRPPMAPDPVCSGVTAVRRALAGSRGQRPGRGRRPWVQHQQEGGWGDRFLCESNRETGRTWVGGGPVVGGLRCPTRSFRGTPRVLNKRGPAGRWPPGRDAPFSSGPPACGPARVRGTNHWSGRDRVLKPQAAGSALLRDSDSYR